ncbi:hypothetical protein SEA_THREERNGTARJAY_96 [Mycobacterium phage ThreeRngTarjay]|uniref:hypothetical protein n=1 Tax=Mycobacterium phage Minerva TaxID=1527513 RepID=UPI0004EF7C25|nr:hypothetical protein VC71_gp099 [Mycobacterium phage Minerva]AIK69308.1 hypothetical protein PBI_MINERVA_99 [Mycobacterium phage Minerva]ATN89813.1 hypothetical protein SEA_KLEIN_100 [Mycobacterium phage Klein]QBI99729.1 hypothetical protein SEA_THREERNGTARJAY_96 [Mycobacterium phage ThreeRngTarjay]QDP43846.1 hypothetical protein SEA_DALLAS_101 [Mycobacterium phage Dallas]
MRNTALLNEVMQFILDYPEAHSQGAWWNAERETSCYGMLTCYLMGHDLLPGYTTLVRDYDGYTVPARDMAAKLLGLNGHEADTLFHGGNTVDELRRMVADLVAGKPLGSATSYWQKAGH